jgi:hypothetical protein
MIDDRASTGSTGQSRCPPSTLETGAEALVAAASGWLSAA